MCRIPRKIPPELSNLWFQEFLAEIVLKYIKYIKYTRYNKFRLFISITWYMEYKEYKKHRQLKRYILVLGKSLYHYVQRLLGGRRGDNIKLK